MINIDNFNSSIFAVMGERAFISKTGGGVLTVVGILEPVSIANAVGYLTINNVSYTLTVLWSDIANYKSSDYKSITVRDEQYQILEVIKDTLNNLGILKLRRFV